MKLGTDKIVQSYYMNNGEASSLLIQDGDTKKDTYIKTELGDRHKDIGGHEIQRDLYSAFLLKNSNEGLTQPDREKCIYGFEKFIKQHDNLINEMKENNVSMKQCFGF